MLCLSTLLGILARIIIVIFSGQGLGYSQSCGTRLLTVLRYMVTHNPAVQGYSQSCGDNALSSIDGVNVCAANHGTSNALDDEREDVRGEKDPGNPLRAQASHVAASEG
jgi:hypothetical protein